MLIDCGATADCTPEFLLQFAFMGSYYAEKVLGIENPRVALLNIGAEDSKGGELQKAVYPLLKQAGETGAINFTGNIEARDVPLGGADVVVADGFSGNILLKGIEGTALFMASMMKNMFKKNVLTKLAALLCMDGVKAFKKKMDYRETGGTALIGLSKPVIKAHGPGHHRLSGEPGLRGRHPQRHPAGHRRRRGGRRRDTGSKYRPYGRSKGVSTC